MRMISQRLLVGAALVVALSGTATAAGCDNVKCGAKGENGHHYGSEKGAGDNGNHFGEEKSDTDSQGSGSTVRSNNGPKPAHVASSGGPVGPAKGKKHVSAQSSGSHKDRLGGDRKRRTERRPDSQGEVVPVAQRSVLKRLASDSVPHHSGAVRSHGAGQSLAWEAPAPELDAIELASSAVDAARALAFPLSLTLAVSAFLLLQGHIDRKDPKLAVWRSEEAQFE